MLKLLALLAGIAGVVGFFLPLAEYSDSTGKVLRTASAYEIATTPTEATGLSDFAKGLGASKEQADRLEQAANRSLLAHRGFIVAFYVPAALQLLLALVNLLRSRVGRFAGFLTLLFGAGSAAVFVYFWIGYERNADPNSALGYGVWLLAGAGAGGMLAGLVTMFRPRHD
ncbi:MAG: hypothetical protein M4D80_29295 [Myxococcota bacterium]|nr:hypothetical protein [Deltaproteobacteria bacterium]MDQ3339279.1 hypothetical protein [Myxococcota bacterium]